MSAAPAHLDNTLGAIVIAATVSLAVFGITCLQSYDFLSHTAKKSAALKYSVIALWLLDTFHSIGLCQMVYDFTVTHFGEVAYLKTNLWSLQACVIVGAVIASVVQGFFASRIMQKNKGMVGVSVAIGVFSLTQLVLTIAYLVEKAKVGTFSDTSLSKPFLIASIACNIVANGLITGASAQYVKDSIPDSQNGVMKFVDTVICYVIDSGFLVTFFAVLSLIFILATPHSLVYLPFYFLGTKFYINSMLCTLNNREYGRGDRSFSDGNTLSLSKVNGTTGASSGIVVAVPHGATQTDTWHENREQSRDSMEKKHDEASSV